MKRYFAIFLAFCLIFGLSACVRDPSAEKPSVSIADPDETTPPYTYAPEENTEEPAPTTEAAEDPMAAYYVPGNSYAKVYRTETGAIWAMVLMEFINVSEENLYFDYANIDLLDKNGEIFQTIETVAFAPQILAPGETGYYCEVIPLDVAEEISLSPKLPKDFRGVSLAENQPVIYEVSEYSLTDSLYGSLELELTVKNTSQNKGELVCIAAILKNEFDEPIGFITGYLDEALGAGKSAEVTFESFMLPPELTAADVSAVEIFAYPLLDQR